MNWSLSSLLFVLGVLAAIAAFVLFIISCVSTTPFNMASRADGLSVSLNLTAIAISTMIVSWGIQEIWHKIEGTPL